MATNVSALRVAITGDAAGLEATLSQGAARVSAFAQSVRQSGEMARKAMNFTSSGGDGLNRELAKAKQMVEGLAGAYVSGGNVTRQQLDAAIAREKQLQRQIEARKTLIDSLRGTGGNLTELRGAASYRPTDRRSEEEQLSRVRQLIQHVSAEEVRSGQSRSAQLQRLIRLEAALGQQIANRTAVINSARTAVLGEAAAMTQAATAANRFGMGGSRTTQIVQQLGFAAEDAAVSYGITGLGGALRGSANNLALVAGMFNPLAGAAVGVGAAIGSFLIPQLMKLGDATEDAVNWADSLEKSWDRLAAVRANLGFAVGRQRQVGPAWQSAADWRERQTTNEERTQIVGGEMRFAEGRLRQLLESRLNKSVIDDLLHDMSTSDPMSGRSVLLELDNQQRSIAGNPLFANDDPRRSEALQLEQDFRQAQLEFKHLRDTWFDITVPMEAQKKREAAMNAVMPFLEQGGNRLAGFWMNMQKNGEAARKLAKEREAYKPQLAGGAQKGSRDAMSLINRALFTTSKAEEKIEKNTAATVKAVDNVAAQVAKIAIPAIVGGPPIP